MGDVEERLARVRKIFGNCDPICLVVGHAELESGIQLFLPVRRIWDDTGALGTAIPHRTHDWGREIYFAGVGGTIDGGHKMVNGEGETLANVGGSDNRPTCGVGDKLPCSGKRQVCALLARPRVKGTIFDTTPKL